MACRSGELREHRLLGSESLYRVLAVEGELAHLEVLTAPGLAPGLVVRFQAQAVEQMRLVDGAPSLTDIVAGWERDLRAA